MDSVQLFLIQCFRSKGFIAQRRQQIVLDEMGDIAMKGKRLKKINTTLKRDKDDPSGSCEPVSPLGRIFLQSSLSIYIICLFGCKEEIDIELLKTNIENSPWVAHKRFRSVVKKDGRGKLRWVQTRLNLSDHIIVPAIDPVADYSPDFVNDYANELASAAPLDPSVHPPWQIHVLNVKSSEGAATMILRIHHSLADAISLMSLVFACSRKTRDPTSLPSFPCARPKKTKETLGFARLFGSFCRFMSVIFSSIIYFSDHLATLANYRRDSDTPIKGSDGGEFKPKRVAHVTVSLDDVKTVKNAVNGTINDVILGMVSAGLFRYLQRIYASRGEVMPSDLLVRVLISMNLRPATGIQELADMIKGKGPSRWGNDLGLILIPTSMIRYDDPLDYVRAAAKITARKKLSLEGHITNFFATWLPGQLVKNMFYKEILNTTLSLSNMVGPTEEIEFFGQPISYMAPVVSGHPHAMIVSFMSYMDKVTIVVTAIEEVIPDPQQLCLDFVEVLGKMGRRSKI